MPKVTYYSTNDKSERVSFETALMNGLASNYGLYMISRKDIPRIAPGIPEGHEGYALCGDCL